MAAQLPRPDATAPVNSIGGVMPRKALAVHIDDRFADAPEIGELTDHEFRMFFKNLVAEACGNPFDPPTRTTNRLRAHGLLRDEGGVSKLGKRWLGRVTREDRRRPIPADLRASVYARDGYACVFCGAGETLSIDHIYPWSRGGPDAYENLQTLCRSCNSTKGARTS